jgi:hypothetical protein
MRPMLISVVFFSFNPSLQSAGIDRLYLLHIEKKGKERGKEGAVIAGSEGGREA